MRFQFRTQNTCSQIIYFDLENKVVSNIEFLGGCNGNLKAVSKLVDGKTVDEIEQLLAGITCGPRDTSCADQLAQAVRAAQDHLEKEQQ